MKSVWKGASVDELEEFDGLEKKMGRMESNKSVRLAMTPSNKKRIPSVQS